MFSYSLGTPFIGGHPRTRPRELQGEASLRFQTLTLFTLATGNGLSSKVTQMTFPLGLEIFVIEEDRSQHK